MARNGITGRFQSDETDLARFERKFIPEPNSGCWLWFAATNTDGYGWFRLDRQHTKASRAAWQLYRGTILAGQMVLHRCDTPACVNPDHLFLGTAKDNRDDCVAKGRTRWVASNAKLAAHEVLSILRDPRSYRVIAEEFGVSAATVCMIKRGQVWRDVTQAEQ